MSVLRRPRGQIHPVTVNPDREEFFFSGNPFLKEESQEMEDLDKRAIEDLPVVSSVCLHTGDKTHKAGVYTNLRCCVTSSYGVCGATLVGTIHKSIERPTTVDYLREFGRVIQRDHGPTCIAATQQLQTTEKDATDVSTKRAPDADEGAATASPGIRNRDVRVAEIVTRELEKTKPDKWGCVQARDLWSPKEEIQVRPGHF